ncbi:MAG: nuclear transport factor 2 family protein, partial [Myxococcota bacterium]
AVYETTRTFAAPLVPLRRWIEEENRIVAAMEETERIRKPVGVEVLHGTWPEPGAVRRVELADGHFVLERVLVNDFPALFRYQVWNYTSAAGKSLSYAVGQQAWEVAPGGGATLTWTYRLKPDAFYKRPFVQRFVDEDMRPLMDRALDAVQRRAETHFAGSLPGPTDPVDGSTVGAPSVTRASRLRLADRFFEALADGEAETALSLLTPEAMLYAPYNPNGDASDAGIRAFPASMYVRGALATYDPLVFVERKVSIADEGSVLWIEAEGRLRVAATGRPYENRYVFKIELEGDRIASITEYTNVATLARDGVVATVP